jgi:hypothetical protein
MHRNEPINRNEQIKGSTEVRGRLEMFDAYSPYCPLFLPLAEIADRFE